MGLLDRLRAWWRRLGGESPAAVDGADPSTAGYECAVCGTVVDDPAGECPLCRSTDVVTAGATAEADADPAADGRRHVGADAGESVDRLRELHEDADLLQRYDDHWREVDGDYRVETSDGTRVVGSREEAAALLRAETR